MTPSYFVWDVDRMIVHIAGPFGVRWYSLLFLAGILIGNALFLRMMRAEGRSTARMDTLLYYIVIGTVVGARLGHCLFYGFDEYIHDPIRILKIWEGGLASHGGFTGVLLAMVIFTRRYKEEKMSFLYLADRMAIPAIMAGGFIRIGNFFNSEIVGRPTDVPWAVIFAKVDALPRHPTEIYEALGYFAVSLLCYLAYRMAGRTPPEGRILGICFVAGFSFRFFIEQYKVNQEAFEDAMRYNMGQLLSVPFVLIGIVLIIGVKKVLRPCTRANIGNGA